MRKILIILAAAIVFGVGCLATWIFGGHQISLFVERFGTIEKNSARIHSLVYEGDGTGGVLRVNELELSLNDTNDLALNVGTTKDDQLGLASGGKVFPFGPTRSDSRNLAVVPPAGDDAVVEIRRSILSWPTPFEINFMTGNSPSWKRHLYYRIRWKKRDGATLEMLWRYEQFFYPPSGWANGFMTHAGSTGLIRVTIKD